MIPERFAWPRTAWCSIGAPGVRNAIGITAHHVRRAGCCPVGEMRDVPTMISPRKRPVWRLGIKILERCIRNSTEAGSVHSDREVAPVPSRRRVPETVTTDWLGQSDAVRPRTAPLGRPEWPDLPPRPWRLGFRSTNSAVQNNASCAASSQGVAIVPHRAVIGRYATR